MYSDWIRPLAGLPYLKRTQQAFVHAHHRTGVVELSAIVGCAEERHELPFREKLVAILHHLMCSTDQIHVVLLEEAGHDIRTEGEGYTTVIFAPSRDVFVGVRPQQVT